MLFTVTLSCQLMTGAIYRTGDITVTLCNKYVTSCFYIHHYLVLI